MFASTFKGLFKHCDVRSMMLLHSEIEPVLRDISVDFAGGCSLNKAFLMAELIRRYDMQVTVDIGVLRGRSLFPQALAHRRFTGGVVYGIDPWSATDAREYDNPELRKKIDQWIDNADFNALFEKVKSLVDNLELKRHCVLLRQTSAHAIAFFEKNDIYFDLIHIDGNHDTNIVMKDVRLYAPRMKNNGFIVVDDISWKSVKPAYEELKSTMATVFDNSDYAILWNGASRLGEKTRYCILRCLGGN
jgi:hypothetical protein